MEAEDFEKQLTALFQQMQDDSDRMADAWNNVGGLMLAYSKNQQLLFARLASIFDDSRKQRPTPVQAAPAAPPLTSHPAYQTPPGYPATSAQPPWPPAQPQVGSGPTGYPTGYVNPNGAPNGSGGMPYNLREALHAAGQQHAAQPGRTRQ